MTVITRRRVLGTIAGAIAAPAVLARAAGRPAITDGVMSGDVSGDAAVIWSRTDRTARMAVEWSTTDSFRDARRVTGALAVAGNDYTATATLTGLPPGQSIFYRVRFAADDGGESEPAHGRLRTPAAAGGRISLVFGGDQCGAGWGINPDWGGLRIYKAMLDTDPDLLVHLGDRIYSDNILPETVTLPDGAVWRNIVTAAKAKVAETLDDYRGNYRYNLLDQHVRRFHAAVPQLVTWDDHEVTNDWWPGKTTSKRRAERLGYSERSVDVLAARGRKAFFEYTPVGASAARAQRIWRSVRYGPLAEVFLLDSRSHRSPNRIKDSDRMADDAALLGKAQVAWLKDALARSTAQWKIIANPLPITHYSRNDAERGYFDKYANGEPGTPSGREREIADILSTIKMHGMRNVVWLTADVHYAAAHHCHPDRAGTHDFLPFWEFVAGPFHTRAYRPGLIDPTFGAERIYASTTGIKGNPPPSAGWCNFGHIQIDGKSGALTIGFRNVDGKLLWQRTIEAAR